MKCNECKHEVNNKDAYCNYCGHKIDLLAKEGIQKKTYKNIWVSGGVALVIIAFLVMSISMVLNKDSKDKLVDQETETHEESEIANEDKVIITKVDTYEILPVDFIEYPESEVFEETVDETDNKAIVLRAYPTEGTIGTTITIEGENLLGLQEVLLGDVPIPIKSRSHNKVDSVVTSIMNPGEHTIDVIIESELSQVGTFVVSENLTEEILVEEITDIEAMHYFETEELNLFIPVGALNEPGNLIVNKVTNMDIAMFSNGDYETRYYSLTIDDQHQFNDRISFAVDLPEGYLESNKTPLVLSLDEESGIWVPVFSEITETNKLAVRTDHFSYFAIILNADVHLTPDRAFAIFYDVDDAAFGLGNRSISQLAEKVGMHLMESVAVYDNVLGSSYQLDTKLPRTVVISSLQNATGATYYPLNKIMYFPAKYKDEIDLKTTVAHELFHVYQNVNKNWLEMGYQRWVTEAMAEYASTRIAYNITPKVWEGGNSNVEVFKVDNVNEYSQASFIDFVIQKYSLDFRDLYKTYLDNSSLDMKSITVLEDFIKSGGGNIEDDYNEFWKTSLTCSQPLRLVSPYKAITGNPVPIVESAISKINIARVIDEMSHNYYSFFIYKDKENVPNRYIKVMNISGHETMAILLDNKQEKVKGSSTIEHHNTIMFGSMLKEAPEWNKIDGSKDIFVMNDRDILLVGVFDSGNAKYQIKEVEAIAVTKELFVDSFDEAVKIEFGFSKIFEEVDSMSIETHFGDGEMDSKNYTNEKTINIRYKHYYKQMPTSDVEIYLYDTTAGKKEIIGEIIIPLKSEQVIVLDVNHYNPEIDENLVFDVNIKNKAFTYEWDFGDGSEQVSDDANRKNYAYSKAGEYIAKVSIYDNDSLLIGIGECLVDVKEADKDDDEEEIEEIQEIQEQVDDKITRLYTPIAKASDLVDLTTETSLYAIMDIVFGKPILEVEPEITYKDGVIFSAEYNKRINDNEHVIIIMVYYFSDGGINAINVYEFIRDRDNTKYNIDIRFDYSSKRMRVYMAVITDDFLQNANAIHGYDARYNEGVLVQDIYGERGKQIGTGYTYYDSGALKTEFDTRYTDEVWIMHALGYYEDGGLKTDINYSGKINDIVGQQSDHRHGSYTFYATNGNVVVESTYINGTQVGSLLHYYEDTGTIRRKGYYDENGNQISWVEYDRSGAVTIRSDD